MTRILSAVGLVLIALFASSGDGVLAARDTSSKIFAEKRIPPALAATPPMGWNSWDSFGTTIGEADVKATAEWMATNLKPYGWQYVVVDEGWFLGNPTADTNATPSQYMLDEFGRYIPDPKRFPSAAQGAGFKPLADYVHSLGLKFGIHILRGIPRQAVEKNLPVAGSSYHAAEVGARSDVCPWNHDNYGTDAANPASQAYYDSIAQLYASWGVDFVKADCISSRPYKGDDIRMLSTALHKTGREIVLSLSPGEAPIEKSMNCASIRNRGASQTTYGMYGAARRTFRRECLIRFRAWKNGSARRSPDTGPTRTCCRLAIWGPRRAGRRCAHRGSRVMNSGRC